MFYGQTYLHNCAMQPYITGDRLMNISINYVEKTVIFKWTSFAIGGKIKVLLFPSPLHKQISNANYKAT